MACRVTFMTPGMDRRGTSDGKRRIVWPEWARIAYRALNTKWGQRLVRCAFGFLVFGFIAGGVTLYVITKVPPEEVQVIEQKVETLQSKAEGAAQKAEEAEVKAEGAERKAERDASTLEHRLERIEQIITDVITAP